MAQKFFWYELLTSDRAAAEAFYTKVVGWTLSPFGDPADPYMIVEAAGQGIGGIMTIPAEAAKHGVTPCWIGYLPVADIDAAVTDIKAAGGQVHKDPEPIPGVGRFAIIEDPQGAIFNILQPEGEGMTPLPPGTLGTGHWHELHAADWEKAFPFYASLFGWSKTEAMDMGPMGTYQMVAMEDGAENPNGAMFNDPAAKKPYWLFYIEVDAIDAAVERVQAAGGTIVFGPIDVPGGNWVVTATDPQGALFALVAARR